MRKCAHNNGYQGGCTGTTPKPPPKHRMQRAQGLSHSCHLPWPYNTVRSVDG